ncbi:MAG: maleylpyruvate isomerase N-terminal domain-containing protein [Acidimicrobiia bacterium]
MDAPKEDLEGLRDADRRLAATLHAPFDPTSPSRLPGWTVGHVLTHIARNADGMRRMFLGAARGVVADMYPDGAAGRSAAIEAGAARDRTALIADVESATAALAAAVAEVGADGWRDGAGRTLGGVVPLPRLLVGRWREVAIHHRDLGLDVDWIDWPAPFVARMLPLRLAEVNGRLPPERRLTIAAPDGTTIGDGGPVVVRADRGRALSYLFGRVELPDAPPIEY